VIVGLQTDKPFKRAIMPTGGFRMVEAGLKAAGFESIPRCATPSPSTARPTTTASSTCTRRRSAPAGKSGIITGLPDAYGRGRIIGDYRRVALYGVDR
jgi:formate C-acetyltransferase